MIKLSNVILALGLASLLAGCADHIGPRKGTEIQVVPVTYRMAVAIKDRQAKQAREQLDQYVEKYWKVIASQDVQLQWASPAGKKLAQRYSKSLLSRGLDSSKLTVVEAQAGKASTFLFDLQLIAVESQAIVATCGHERVGNFGVQEQGCYADAARWQSMLHPEKMLISKAEYDTAESSMSKNNKANKK